MDSVGGSTGVDVLGGAQPISTAAGSGESTEFRLFNASGAEDGNSQLLTASGTQDNSVLTSTQNTSLAAPQDPVQALMAIPATVVNIAARFVAAVLSPFLAPGPVTPTQPPLLLFAVLDWVRREIQRTFFNRSPIAVANVYTTSEDVGLTGNVLTDGTDDTDADGDPLTASLVTGPAHGDVTLNADGSFTYTPDANYHGTDTFTYNVSDETGGWHLHGLFGLFGGGHTDTATVTVNITAVNETPVAGDDNLSTNEDTSVTFAVLTNDTDADGDPLSVAVNPYPQAAHGSVAINGNGTLTYTPNFNFNGTDTITYTVTDGDASDTGTVTVTVNPANDMPVAMGDNYTVIQNATLDVAGPGVLQNDTDIDGDPLTAVQFTDPSHGSVMFNADGSFTYTPDADFFGTDSFEYYADDGTTTSGGAFVNITVTEDLPNAAPVANYDSFATDVDTPVTIDAEQLLANDFDRESDPLTVIVNQAPEHGELVDNGDGSYTYEPETGFVGTDTFQYAVADATGEGNVAVVSINVGIPANSVPVASPDLVSTRVDTPRVITPGELVGNDTDADGETLTPYVVSDPAHGTLELNTGGTWTYTPDAGFTGIDSFYYTAFDGFADSTPTLVTVQVAGQPDGNTLPVAGYDSFGTDIDTPLTIDPNTLLANDFDADGDPLTVSVTQQPTNGTLSTDALGNLVYTPDDGFTGIDSFFYSAGYPENSSLPAEVTINVGGPANAAPQATPDNLVTGIGAPLTITSEDLLDNDADAEGDTLYAYVVSDPAHGTLEDNGDGTYTYTPDATYVGMDGFYYTAFDGQADSTPTVVTIEVGGVVNIPPIANDDELATAVDTPLPITRDDLVGNDEDPDGDPDLLGGQILEEPDHGTLATDEQTGNLIYTPDAGFEGIDTFTYQLTDFQDDSNIAVVTVTVGQPSINTVPVAGWDSLATDEDTPLTITDAELLGNDFDADTDPLTVTVIQVPSHGTLTVNPDGTRTYTPDAGFTGEDTFQYVTSDGRTTSFLAQVTIAVGIPANTTPMATPDELSTPADTALTFNPDDLLTNDLDTEDDPLTPYIISDPTNGTLEYNAQDDTYTYTPNAGFEGTDTFHYTAYDGTSDSTPTQVTITVGAVTGAPLVINEVYGGGGNTGAPYTNDFIELKNVSNSTIDLTGLSVQYHSSSPTGTWQVTPLSGTVGAGAHWLVQEGAGANGVPLPTPDSAGTISMSATSGTVALVIGTTPLTCGPDCWSDPRVIDLVGYGSAGIFEGPSAAIGASNTTSVQRGASADNDNNGADFSAGAPTPTTSGGGSVV